jgi:hypothetical protein
MSVAAAIGVGCTVGPPASSRASAGSDRKRGAAMRTREMGYQDKARRIDPRAPAVIRGRIADTDVSASEESACDPTVARTRS